ncbi:MULTISPECIES: hypothetical protein [Oceanobacillus]|uniref:Uncharacterized protein n=1 Tax=Oceanobacillus indicireducens TaxID=1004261 RepID=A0A918D5E7_9BACI|nr:MULTISPECIES: hypothetical protein [Oceanobacillus]GGN66631.1 hypothetical protein GCM10007971_36880 [Oceanobacillus indicireducens]
MFLFKLKFLTLEAEALFLKDKYKILLGFVWKKNKFRALVELINETKQTILQVTFPSAELDWCILNRLNASHVIAYMAATVVWLFPRKRILLKVGQHRDVAITYL